jgi:AmmeMemoRadiSam system radical SAM enzyme
MMSTNEPTIRRTDRASDDAQIRAKQMPGEVKASRIRASAEAPDLTKEISKLRKPIAGASKLADAINLKVREGDLYEKLPGGRVHCFACGHHCKINDGGRGICQVRYNVGGTLYVPRGYVAALQCDPIEKKPFFHVHPGSDALTFGMLGCDLHCGYCFLPEIVVLTNLGPKKIADVFGMATKIEHKPDAEIAYPDGLQAISASGVQRRIQALFRHPYRGKVAAIQPYYLPALRCTPDHRVYATDDTSTPPQLMQAQDLTTKHYLAVPRHYSFSSAQVVDVARELSKHRVTYHVAWDLSADQRAEIVDATSQGDSSRLIGKRLGKSASYIRHVRSKIGRGLGGDLRTGGALIGAGTLRFPNEHCPGIPLVIPLDEGMARLLGYYCAEGSVVSDKQRPNSFALNFSFSKQETAQAEEVQGLLKQCFGVDAALVSRTTTLAVSLKKSSAALLFKSLCGGRANEKRVPQIIFEAPRSVVNAFVDAYVEGDGHRYPEGRVNIGTVSHSLAYGIAELVLKLGYLPSLYDKQVPEWGVILGRTVRQSPHRYSVYWYQNNSVARRIVETEEYYLIPLRDISFADYDGDVYNMQVETEHNYLAGFFAVSNCQNWDISQALRDASAGRPPTAVTPKQMVELGKSNGAKVVASSYNEPLITSEWAVEIFKEAKANGFVCAYVSNGNATREVLEYLRPYVSAYKIDLKSMRDKNYRQLGAPLQNILDGAKMVHEMGFWLEIVTLLVPGFNDSTEELLDAARFIASLSRDIPWHVTAFHQDYKMTDHDNTSRATLIRAAEIGVEAGLNYVYAGNLPGQVGEYENTYCPNCRQLLIERFGYTILNYRITGAGTCPKCGTRIAGVWPRDPAEVRLGLADLWFARRPRSVR